MNNTTYNVIDLFCGCGGLSLGFEKAGYNILLGIDIWKDALTTYKHNHKGSATLCADLSVLSPTEVDTIIKAQKVDVIIGGPPCQGFSVAGKRIVDDERNKLYKGFVRMVEHYKPRAFVLENVPNILSIGNGVIRDAIVADFTQIGYKMTYKVLLASDYGVPQNRRRAIFVGLLENDFDFHIPEMEHKVTTEEALSDLPEYSIPDGKKNISPALSDYQKEMRRNSDCIWNHEVTIHNKQTTDIIALVPDGGNYKNLPDKFWHRIHFVRPRFKSNIENVLLYMANECCRIPKCSCEEYNQRYFNAIKMFPGNIDMADKTLHNWRTEISALFSFYTEHKDINITETSNMARFLHENQDLTQFLRLFLFSFQFPGGHLKPQELQNIIYNKIRFKPAKSIIQVLMAGNRILHEEGSLKVMSISAEEATYCIFNDTRFTSGITTPEETASIILSNRRNKMKYYNPQNSKFLSSTGKARSKGDMTRYAGDILDYMEIANLLESHNGYFTLKGNESTSLRIFAEDTTFFTGYEQFYNKDIPSVSELSKIEPSWFEYVNLSMRPDLFKTDIESLFTEDNSIDVILEDSLIPGSSANIEEVFNTRIQNIVSSKEKTTKDIGNLGEALICGHEKMRLKLHGYEEFARLVQIADSPSYHPGFDIDSYEADGTEDHRYIEVKTTISKQKIQMYGFHMSPNEWRVAGTIKEHYCIYRLMLSEQGKTLFILRDPVRLYKTDKIEAEPRDGMEITFSTDIFKPTDLLTWKR